MLYLESAGTTGPVLGLGLLLLMSKLPLGSLWTLLSTSAPVVPLAHAPTFGYCFLNRSPHLLQLQSSPA